MKFIKTPVKGMCDMLPADMRLREHVLGMIKETYGACGFMQIETPVMEHIENLTSKQGGDNEKLIFKVMKRGAELQRALDKGDGELADNGLRYDLTVPLARYYANNKETAADPVQGDAAWQRLARGQPAEGALPPVYPVRHRHSGRRQQPGGDRADYGDGDDAQQDPCRGET